MLVMTSPSAATRRLILLPAAPSRSGRGDAMVRRYRIARLRLEGRDVSRAERFEHVKRSYD